MSISYNPATNFSIKDTMGSTNPDKILSGVPFDAEFEAISASFQLAAPALNPNFTGTVTVDALTASTVNGTVTSTWDTAATEVSTNASGWTATKATVDAGESNWDEAYGWGNHADAGYVTTDGNTDTTYSAGTNLNLSGTTFNLDDSITLSSVQATTQKIGSDWSAYADGSSLKFYYQGSARMVLDSNGTLTVMGNVIAYGSF
jgi:hypothetical protein